jgi:hypothetical protein
MSKQAGRMSQSANDFLEPKAPIDVVGTDVGTARAFDNGAVSVAFSLPADSPAATTYTVTASTGQTATGASSPITVTGIASGATPTFTVTATNASGTSAASSASAAVTVTTVPATPSAPTASTVANQAQDSVSWTAPANGGKAITGYTWSSSDSKTGTTASTSVTVNQEAGTAQTYNVYATNANGNSATSANSGSVTTFSFVPYSFTPYAFTPYAFTPFAFTPAYNFTPSFWFVPAYGFSPYGFVPNAGKSLGPETLVLTTNGLTAAANIQVGDTLVSVELPGLVQNSSFENMLSWSSTDTEFDLSNTVTTTVTHVAANEVTTSVVVNYELFSGTHFMLTKRDGVAKMIATKDLLMSDELWSSDTNTWTAIYQLVIKDIPHTVISINCEPYDMFFTDKFLVYDGYQIEN